MNSYSRGDIAGNENAAGICGGNTGSNQGHVTIANVYASGSITWDGGGGIIERVAGNIGSISITASVYNGSQGRQIEGKKSDKNSSQQNNSGDLDSIKGEIYCFGENDAAEKCWNSETIWQVVENNFPVLKLHFSKPALPSRTSSPFPTATMSNTKTSSSTPTVSARASSTSTQSSSRSPSATHTSMLSSRSPSSNGESTATDVFTYTLSPSTSAVSQPHSATATFSRIPSLSTEPFKRSYTVSFSSSSTFELSPSGTEIPALPNFDAVIFS